MNTIFKKEILQHNSSIKRLCGMKNALMVLLLQPEEYKINDVTNLLYVKEKDMKDRSALLDKEKEITKLETRVRGQNIPNNDCLIFMRQCFQIKSKYFTVRLKIY